MDQRKAAAAAAAENKWRIININAAVFGNEMDMNWSYKICKFCFVYIFFELCTVKRVSFDFFFLISLLLII